MANLIGIDVMPGVESVPNVNRNHFPTNPSHDAKGNGAKLLFGFRGRKGHIGQVWPMVDKLEHVVLFDDPKSVLVHKIRGKLVCWLRH